jgi:regulatory protein
MLSARRLTEAQLWGRLCRRGFDDPQVRAAVDWCKAEGYLDDRLYARLYVEGKVKAVGDARLVAELVRRGVEREIAARSVASAERDQEARLEQAAERLLCTTPTPGYPSVARALERMGFPAAAIYRHLRSHASRFGPLAGAAEDCDSLVP